MTDGAAFYAAAAGAIPLLYLTLTVQDRSEGSDIFQQLAEQFVADPAQRAVVAGLLRAVYLLVVASVLLTGVAAAFVGLSHPRWGLSFKVGYTGFFVAAALAFGTGVLVLRAFLELVLTAMSGSDLSPTFRLYVLVGALVLSTSVLVGVGSFVTALLH
jgi:hypothetical protein